MYLGYECTSKQKYTPIFRDEELIKKLSLQCVLSLVRQFAEFVHKLNCAGFKYGYLDLNSLSIVRKAGASEFDQDEELAIFDFNCQINGKAVSGVGLDEATRLCKRLKLSKEMPS